MQGISWGWLRQKNSNLKHHIVNPGLVPVMLHVEFVISILSKVFTLSFNRVL